MTRFLLTVTLLGLVAVQNVSAATYSEDFSAGDGGFAVTNTGGPEGPWTYDGASTWSANGSADLGVPSHTRLTSPTLTIGADGAVELSFDHRYSIEPDLWDGAAVFASVNGAAFTQIPKADFSANGYDNTGPLIGNHDLKDGDGYNGDSADYASGTYITSVATLGTLSSGDTVAVQFLGAWDEFSKGTEPNWQIDSVSVTNVVPEPSALGLAVLAFLGLGGCSLRRKPRA